MRVSAVIPVLDEAESLEKLHGELSEVARSRGYDMEVIFVDDGSTDGSWGMIERLAGVDPRVRGIRFRRNFGKAAALSAGFAEARGELIMTLDADLQDDPHEIPSFLAEMEKNLDVVSGWKKVRHDPWHKVIPSRVFNWMVSWLTGVKLHDHNCGMKCYRREVFDEVRLYGELHRFVPVLAAARGFRVGELVIQHRQREFGRSKYGVTRIIKGFLDLLTVKFLTGFGQRPQHVLGTIGITSFLLGGLWLTYMATRWVLSRVFMFAGLIEDPNVAAGLIKAWESPILFHLHDHPTAALYSVALLLLGGQLMSMGFLGELIIAYQQRDMKTYSIAERTGSVVPSSSPAHSEDAGAEDQ
ncbi:MAG: glycosyltransferase family 2 protein [Planctomycetota bacterium]